MTLNERFVGGNPRVLLLLFCLFCVVLICLVGICPNMMRQSKIFLKPLTRNQTHHIHFSRRLARPVPVVARPCQPISQKKNLFFFFSLIQKNTTSFILKTSMSISIHHSQHKPQSKPTFIHPNTEFVHHETLTQKQKILHQSPSFNS